MSQVRRAAVDPQEAGGGFLRRLARLINAAMVGLDLRQHIQRRQARHS